MSTDVTTWATAGLWLAVVVSGLYHGLNPGMGWPLAVSAGLMGRGRRDLVAALPPLAAGHFLAMAAVLLPFAALTVLYDWQREIRVGAGLVVVAVGLYLLVNRRHPRVLARIRPTQLTLWSFAVATAHGAGFMLVPILLGLCRAEDVEGGHRAAAVLIGGSLPTAVAVAALHTLAMVAAGGGVAVAVYEWLGLTFLKKSWFNLDLVWALSLVAVGAIGVAAAVAA